MQVTATSRQIEALDLLGLWAADAALLTSDEQFLQSTIDPNTRACDVSEEARAALIAIANYFDDLAEVQFTSPIDADRRNHARSDRDCIERLAAKMTRRLAGHE